MRRAVDCGARASAAGGPVAAHSSLRPRGRYARRTVNGPRRRRAPRRSSKTPTAAPSADVVEPPNEEEPELRRLLWIARRLIAGGDSRGALIVLRGVAAWLGPERHSEPAVQLELLRSGFHDQRGTRAEVSA